MNLTDCEIEDGAANGVSCDPDFTTQLFDHFFSDGESHTGSGQ